MRKTSHLFTARFSVI